MEHAKTCQRPISLERRLAATYLVAGLVTAGLAGCAAGPDFQRPTAPDVARYTATPVADRGSKPEPPKIPSADQRGLSRARSMG